MRGREEREGGRKKGRKEQERKRRIPYFRRKVFPFGSNSGPQPRFREQKAPSVLRSSRAVLLRWWNAFCYLEMSCLSVDHPKEKVSTLRKRNISGMSGNEKERKKGQKKRSHRFKEVWEMSKVVRNPVNC